MRIHDGSTSTAITRTANGLAPGKGKSTSESAATTESDATTVKLSAKAQQLASSSARIDELRSQVQAGTYKVDAQAIADRLVGP